MQSGEEIMMTKDQQLVFSPEFQVGATSCQTQMQQTVAISPCKADYCGLAGPVQEGTIL